LNYSLQSIGVPLVYRTENPFRLQAQQRLDAFPSLANPAAVAIWMTLRGDTQQQSVHAWISILAQFEAQCRKSGLTAFILDSSRRNADEEVRSFLAVWRKRVRDYLDPLGLVTLPIFRTSHFYTRNSNSWWLRSQSRIIKKLEGVAIGQALQAEHRWLRTHCPEYRGSQSWHRWILWGVVRVGWSTSGTDSWLWYEIRCPHMPGITTDGRSIDDTAFNKHLDKMWLPLVKNLRWWSTSNPRLWEF
jgi:hypothetical protein